MRSLRVVLPISSKPDINCIISLKAITVLPSQYRLSNINSVEIIISICHLMTIIMTLFGSDILLIAYNRCGQGVKILMPLKFRIVNPFALFD